MVDAELFEIEKQVFDIVFAVVVTALFEFLRNRNEGQYDVRYQTQNEAKAAFSADNLSRLEIKLIHDHFFTQKNAGL
jgi:hypothetical protein